MEGKGGIDRKGDMPNRRCTLYTSKGAIFLGIRVVKKLTWTGGLLLLSRVSMESRIGQGCLYNSPSVFWLLICYLCKDPINPPKTNTHAPPKHVRKGNHNSI